MDGDWESVRNKDIGADFELYKITNTALRTMGLDEIVNEDGEIEYLVIYDKTDFTKMDVIYLSGFKYSGNTGYVYTLTQIKDAE